MAQEFSIFFESESGGECISPSKDSYENTVYFLYLLGRARPGRVWPNSNGATHRKLGAIRGPCGFGNPDGERDGFK